ncbi:MAG: dockerin type I domain-containing protein [Candidatus Diapherotrites archaeon]
MKHQKIFLVLLLFMALLVLSGCYNNVPVCGNDICEIGENAEICPVDCDFEEDPPGKECLVAMDCDDNDRFTDDTCEGMPKTCRNRLMACGELDGVICGYDSICDKDLVNSADSGRCCPGNCTYADKCSADSDCDDSIVSTEDICIGEPKQCINLNIEDCRTGDSYCPPSCSYGNDSDCPTEDQCNYDSECNDYDNSTRDACVGNPKRCINTLKTCAEREGDICTVDEKCLEYFMSSFDSQRCCAGTCILECLNDSECNDQNPSTRDSCEGNPKRCFNETITECNSNDDFCPSGCSSENDNDCPEGCDGDECNYCHNYCQGILGDIDGDGVITEEDYQLAIDMSLEIIDPNPCADISQDCEINVIDVQQIANLVITQSYCSDFNTMFLDSWQKSCGDASFDPRADVSSPDGTSDGTVDVWDFMVFTDNHNNEQWCEQALNSTNNICGLCHTNCTGRLGDVTGDGIITQQDVDWIQEMAVDLRERQACADLTMDCEVNTGDAILALQAIQRYDSASCTNTSMKGDLNEDGQVTERDAATILAIAVGLVAAPSNICCADINDDGMINAGDGILALQTVAGTRAIEYCATSSFEGTYKEGEIIAHLDGKCNYNLEKLSVKLDAISQSGPNQPYNATLSLYSSNGTKIDTQTISAGADLSEIFVDNYGDYPLFSRVRVSTITVGATTGIGAIEVLDYGDNTTTCSAPPQPDTQTYNEGESITNLDGMCNYNGESLKVVVEGILDTGSGVYSARFALYQSDGTKIDTQTVSTGTDLSQVFIDSSGNYTLKSRITVDTIAVNATTVTGYVEVTDNGDSTASCDASPQPQIQVYYEGETIAQLDGICTYEGQKVSLKLDGITSSGPNNPYSATLSLYSDTGIKIDTRSVGSGTDLSLEFYDNIGDPALKSIIVVQSIGVGATTALGFIEVTDEGDSQLGCSIPLNDTTIKIGRDVEGLDYIAEAGGISFRGADDTQHNIPFYLKPTNNGFTGGAFLFDGRTIWYKIDDGSSYMSDLNITLRPGDYLNENLILYITYTAPSNTTVTSGIGSHNIGANNTITIDGISYIVTGGISNGNNGTVYLTAEGYLELRMSNSTGTVIYNRQGDTSDESYGKLYFNQNEVVDLSSNRNIGLRGNGDRRFYYAFKYAGDYNAAAQVYLMLDADKMGADESNLIQYGKTLEFMGTAVPKHGNIGGESEYITHTSFIPKDWDFNTSNIYTDPAAYFVAQVKVSDPQANGDITAYINTDDGTLLGPFPNSNLSYYYGDLIFDGDPYFRLLSGSFSGFAQEADTYWGAHLRIYPEENAAMAEIILPE